MEIKSSFLKKELEIGEKYNSPVSKLVMEYLNKKGNIDITEFRRLRKLFYTHLKELSQLLVKTPEGILLPSKLGLLKIVRYYPKAPIKNRFCKPGLPKYHLNAHTDGYVLKPVYIKTRYFSKNNLASYYSSFIYTFKFSAFLKRYLAKNAEFIYNDLDNINTLPTNIKFFK